MRRSVKRGFWRGVFTWRATKQITQHGARATAALVILPLLPVFYVAGWVLWLPYAQYRKTMRRRREKRANYDAIPNGTRVRLECRESTCAFSGKQHEGVWVVERFNMDGDYRLEREDGSDSTYAHESVIKRI